MKRLFSVVGVGALLAWTGLGLVAWSSAARRAAVVLDHAESEPDGSARLLALADEVSALRTDLRALADALVTSSRSLHDALAARLDEHAATIASQVAAVRDEVGSRVPPSFDELADLARERHDEPGAAGAPHASSSPPQLVPTAAPEAPAIPPAAAPKARKSFLAFQLPSDDFRFDERRTWSVIPALSRVGFDARSTLHDFSGATSAVEGELSIDLAHPAEEPRVRLRVEAAGLATGDRRRDEAMREHLDVAKHPELEFELTRFESGTIDAGDRKLAGTAHGRMRVRGVEREVSMGVQLALDDAQRLCVEGAMPLDLEHFDVAVPSKLGLITMEKQVEVWISLRLRVKPRTNG